MMINTVIQLTRVIEVLLIAHSWYRWGEVFGTVKLSYIGNGICFRGIRAESALFITSSILMHLNNNRSQKMLFVCAVLS